MRPDTPLTRELHHLVRTIALIAVGVGGGFFVLTLFLDTPPSDGFVFAIGITVALVPEGLLPDRDAVAGDRRPADGRRARTRSTAGVGRDTRFDDVHLHRQDRNAHPEPDEDRRGLDAVRAALRRGGTGYEPDGEIEPMPTMTLLRQVTDLAAVARACSRGRAVRNEDGRWIPSGDPMEAAIDSLAHTARPTTATATSCAPSSPGSRSILAGDDRRSWRQPTGCSSRVLPTRCSNVVDRRRRHDRGDTSGDAGTVRPGSARAGRGRPSGRPDPHRRQPTRPRPTSTCSACSPSRTHHDPRPVTPLPRADVPVSAWR